MRGLQVLPPSSKLFALPFTYPIDKNGKEGSAITFFFELQHELHTKFSTVSYEKHGHSSINNWNKLQGRHSWGVGGGNGRKQKEKRMWLPICLFSLAPMPANIFLSEESGCKMAYVHLTIMYLICVVCSSLLS